MIIWKNINNVTPGELIAEDIYDPSGFVVLLKKGSELNDGDIYLLKNRGITLIPVYAKDMLYSDDVEPTIEVENYQKLSQELEKTFEDVKLGKLQVESVVEKSESIVNEVLEKYENKVLNLINNTQKPIIRHSINTAVISTIIGISLGFDRENLRNLVISSFFHDISHDKPVRDVVNYYDTHPIQSAGLIKNFFGVNSSILLGVLHHHERYDGKGYPRNLKEASIPIFSRIIAVADAYDTLISKDFPGEPVTPYEAIRFIIGNSGRMFDPNVVSKFIHYVGIYPTGTRVQLSNGENGIVIKVSDGLLPVVKVGNKIINLVKNKIYIEKVIKE